MFCRMQKSCLISNQRLFGNTLARRARVIERERSWEELEERSGVNERLVNMGS